MHPGFAGCQWLPDRGPGALDRPGRASQGADWPPRSGSGYKPEITSEEMPMRDKPRSITATALLAAIAPGLAIVLGLAACDSEPTCEKAVDRVLDLVKAEQNEKLLAKFPESERKKLADMMEQSLPRERLITDCKARYTKEQIACTVAAKSLADASSCNQVAMPTGGAPAPTGGAPEPGASPSEPAPGAAPGEPAQGATPAAEGGAGATGGAPGASGQAPAAGEPAQPPQPQ